jgi:hypothetical protein
VVEGPVVGDAVVGGPAGGEVFWMGGKVGGGLGRCAMGIAVTVLGIRVVGGELGGVTVEPCGTGV